MRGSGVIVTLIAAVLGSTAYQVNSISGKPQNIGDLRSSKSTSSAAKSPEAGLLRTFTDFDKGGTFRSPFGNNAGQDQVHNQFDQTYKWLIATVPDPDNSNLRLDFDREVAAIQLAADSAGYQYDRYWFPWGTEEVAAKSSVRTTETDKESSKSAELNEKHVDLKDLPGVLLFRGPRKPLPAKPEEALPALAIFLVAETPTAGVQPRQFRNAICFASSLRTAESDSQTLRILGPSFSGSFSSLAILTKDPKKGLKEKSSLKSRPMFQTIVARSWTSDVQSQRTFEQVLMDRQQKVCLRTTRTSSVASINRFVNYVRDEWRETGPVILLVEEGTGLSAGIRDAAAKRNHGKTCSSDRKRNGFQELQDSCIFVMTFPRNISNLRNATENDTHFPGFGDDSKRQEAPRNGLTFSLKDDKTGISEMIMFSKQQTPVSQESVLFSIGSLLRTETVHYVGIIASNPLDMLFLSRYLKSACPNLRPFTLDSDLLLEHGSDSIDYQGVLAVTSYPLSVISQLWTGSRGALHVFPSSTSEAIHNALSDLLTSWTDQRTTPPDLRDFENPLSQDSKENVYPPLWVTIAGRTGFEPLAILPDVRESESEPQKGDYLLHAKSSTFRKLIPEYRPGWEYAFCFIVCLAVGYSCLLVFASPNGKRSLAIFSAKPDERDAFPRAFYLFAIGMCFCTLVAVWLVVPGEILHENLMRNLGPNAGPEPYAFVKVIIPVAAGLTCSAVFFIILLRIVLSALPGASNGNTLALEYARPVGNETGVIHLLLISFLSVAVMFLFALQQNPFRGEISPILPRLWDLFRFGCFGLGATAMASVLPLVACFRSQTFRKLPEGATRWEQLRQTPYWGGAIAMGILASCLLVYGCSAFVSHNAHSPEHFLAACRSLNLTSGVSPLVPATLLLLNLSLLAFVQLRRITYHEDRCPLVPDLKNDPLCPQLQSVVNEIRDRIRHFEFRRTDFAAMAVALFFAVSFYLRRSQQTFEDDYLETCIFLLAIGSGLFIVLNWVRFLLIWSAFSEFLQQLERHPIRRVFSLLPRGYIWSPVWQGNGKKRTHVAVSRSLECVQALLEHSKTEESLKDKLRPEVSKFSEQVRHLLRISALRRRVPRTEYFELEKTLCEISSLVADHLQEESWPKGGYELKEELAVKEQTKGALHQERPEYKDEEPQTICGELLAYRFLAFINYVIWQLQNLVSYISIGFLLLVVALNSYEFRSHSIIDWSLMGLFIAVSIGIISVFAQADRDAILSRITGTEEGKLDRHFFTHLISYGAVPSLVLAATHFPVVGRFFFSWVKPAIDAIH